MNKQLLHTPHLLSRLTTSSLVMAEMAIATLTLSLMVGTYPSFALELGPKVKQVDSGQVSQLPAHTTAEALGTPISVNCLAPEITLINDSEVADRLAALPAPPPATGNGDRLDVPSASPPVGNESLAAPVIGSCSSSAIGGPGGFRDLPVITLPNSSRESTSCDRSDRLTVFCVELEHQ